MLDFASIQNGLSNETIQLTIAVAILATLYRLYTTLWRPAFPAKAPVLIPEGNPIFGASRFWSSRYEFSKQWTKASGVFSFYLGTYRVVNFSGEAARIAFFENKELNLGEGYFLLTAGKADDTTSGRRFDLHFSDRLNKMMKGENFVKNLPKLIEDIKMRLNILAASPVKITDPFESVYEIVFQLTMRTVGCNEIAENPELLKTIMKFNQTMESAATPTAIMFPWLPSTGVLKMYYAGARMYMIFAKVIKDRQAQGRTEDDAMQLMLDQGDSTKDILAFVLAALFAGQINSGINAAWVLIYLVTNPEWLCKVREQVVSVAQKHNSDPSLSLTEKLSTLPIKVWETEFSLIDLCLRECIRLQLLGSMLRRNISGHDIVVGDILVPKGAYAIYPVADVHHDPEIYPEPEKWDPARHLPNRGEDKKRAHAYIGWGTGRHPCLGMRFAKLEMVLITTFWVAMFDYELVDNEGNPTADIPKTNINAPAACKPTPTRYFKYKLRDAQ